MKLKIKPNENDIVFRLRKRAEIRRQIPNRKSAIEGKPDRIADILEEAASEIEKLRNVIGDMDDIIMRLERRYLD